MQIGGHPTWLSQFASSGLIESTSSLHNLTVSSWSMLTNGIRIRHSLILRLNPENFHRRSCGQLEITLWVVLSVKGRLARFILPHITSPMALRWIPIEQPAYGAHLFMLCTGGAQVRRQERQQPGPGNSPPPSISAPPHRPIVRGHCDRESGLARFRVLSWCVGSDSGHLNE